MGYALGAGAAFALYLVLSLVVSTERRRGVAVGLVATFTFVFYSPTVPRVFTDAATVFDIVLLLLVAVMPRTAPRRINPVLWFVLAYFGSSYISSSLVSPEGLAGNGYLFFMGTIATLLVIVGSQYSEGDRKAFLDGMLFAVTVQAVFGIVEFFIKQPVLWGYKVRDDGIPQFNNNPFFGDAIIRIQGTTAHWIPYSIIIGVGCLVLATQWKRYPRWLAVTLVLLFVVCLPLAGSRSALAVVLIAMLALFLTSKTGNQILRRVVLVLGLGIAVLLAGNWAASTIGEIMDGGSYLNRIGNMAFVPALLGRPLEGSLFGIGLNHVPELFQQDLLLNNGFNVVDNQYVTSLALHGIVGGLAFIAMVLAAWRNSDRIGRTAVGMVIMIAFSFDLQWYPAIWVILFGFAGASEPRSKVRGQPSESVRLPVVPQLTTRRGASA